jgi:hypothetical protein
VRAAALKALGSALVTSALAACGGPSCPQDLPASCPSKPPSYTTDVAPIFAIHCTRCHVAGGTAADRPLTSYADVYAERSPVLNQVYGCEMPPSGYTPLDEDERAKVLGWLVCGAPDD